MIFGMTRAELGLVLFIFALVWGSALLPRLGERVGAILFRRRSD